MKSLLLVFAILLCFSAIVLSSCPSGYELVRNGECRGKFGTFVSEDNNATNVAIDKCNQINGHPPSIHSAEDYHYWQYHDKGYSTGAIVLGLVCDSKTKQWIWSDGSPVDYKPPTDLYNTYLDEECDPDVHCVWDMYGGGSNGGFWLRWCNDSPRTYEYEIYCTVQLQQPSPAGCDDFENDAEDGVCYQVQATTTANWQEAESTCKHLGADVASIHNLKENTFVRRLAMSNGAMNGVFLGATASGKGNDFEWTDGTKWDYENFYPGFPNTKFGSCIAMDTSSPTGQWMNINCTAKLSVACSRKQGSVAEQVCKGPDATWKEGEMITSPGYPFRASTPCDYVLTVPVGKKVSVTIEQLEANTCCDSLVLYDGPEVKTSIDGNWIAKVTGEERNRTYTTPLSNTMRVSWQPNGGVNVRGFAMSFRAV